MIINQRVGLKKLHCLSVPLNKHPYVHSLRVHNLPGVGTNAGYNSTLGVEAHGQGPASSQ